MKNENLDSLIEELRQLLSPAQLNKQCEFETPRWPIGVIVGVPRSGTTLLLQWLASLGVFSYPSNLLSRFAYAPYIGVLIQKMLFDPKYDCNGDLFDLRSDLSFESNLGKSKGALATNEFNHFFRNYMPNYSSRYLDDDELEKVNIKGILNGLASIEYAFNLPFVVKGVLLKYNIKYFYQNLPQIFFIALRRDPLYVMQSLLIARENYHGTREKWFAGKPSQYSRLSKLDIYHQVAGQVYFTDQNILADLNSVPEERKLILKYEEFCKHPETVYRDLVQKYKNIGCFISQTYSGVENIRIKNIKRLSEKDLSKLSSAYLSFSKGDTFL